MEPTINQKSLPTVSELYSQTYELFKKTIIKSFAIGFMYVLLPFVLLVLLCAILASFIGKAALLSLVITVPIFIYCVVRSGIAQAFLYYGNDQEKSYSEYWKMAEGKVLGFFLVSQGQRLITAGGTLLLIIPGIIFSLRYLFTLPVYLLESEKNPGFKKSLAKSRQMTEGYKWGLLGRLLAISLPFLFLFVVIIFGMVFSGMFAPISNVSHVIIIFLVLFGFFFLLISFIGCSGPVLYRALKNDTAVVEGEKTWFIVIMMLLGIVYGVLTSARNLARVQDKMGIGLAGRIDSKFVPVLDAPQVGGTVDGEYIDENGEAQASQTDAPFPKSMQN